MSYPASDPLGLPQLAALVLRELPTKKTVLVAESFSSLVALTLLVQAPGRIRAVIFVGGFAEPPRPLLLRFAPLVARYAGLMRAAPAFVLRQYCLGSAAASDLKMLRDALGTVSPQVLAKRLDLVATRHSFGKGRFDVPCRYLRASHDRLVPEHCATWFQQRFHECEVVDIDGPHFLLQMRARNAAEAIARWIRSLPA